jgi:hypothetical protein
MQQENHPQRVHSKSGKNQSHEEREEAAVIQ